MPSNNQTQQQRPRSNTLGLTDDEVEQYKETFGVGHIQAAIKKFFNVKLKGFG